MRVKECFVQARSDLHVWIVIGFFDLSLARPSLWPSYSIAISPSSCYSCLGPCDTVYDDTSALWHTKGVLKMLLLQPLISSDEHTARVSANTSRKTLQWVYRESRGKKHHLALCQIGYCGKSTCKSPEWQRKHRQNRRPETYASAISSNVCNTASS